ncbi:MAG: copper resistance protein CopC/CopD [Anaerolineae bacterium]|nr:copper resistance protein CopC/CopD [Anaerolineae bacterium]
MRWVNQRRSPLTWLRVLAGLALLVVGGRLAVPALVSAHAVLVRSIPEADAELPQPPLTIDLWFSEALEAGFNHVRLITSTGQAIALGPVTLDPADPAHLTVTVPPLEPGIYTAAWQNLSRVDGHEWVGSFPFTVLNPDGSRPTGARLAPETPRRGDWPSPGETLARWLGLLGGMLLGGGAIFWLVVVPAAPHDELPKLARHLVLRAVWLATLAVVVSVGLQLLLQADRLGGPEQLPDLVLATRTGALALIRATLALVGLLMMLSLPQPRPLHDPEWCFFIQLLIGSVALILLSLLTITQSGRAWLLATAVVSGLSLILAVLARRQEAGGIERRVWLTLLLLAMVLLLTFSLGSHAGAVPGSAWAMLVDYLHLLAAATWVGGLILLAGLVWRANGLASAHGQLLPLVRRFSYLAGLAVLGLAVTGLFSSLVQLPAPADLVGTPYGRVLLLKLLLVGLALLVAWLNNRLVHRRSQPLNQPDGVRRFQRLVAAEAGLSLAILVSVAILVQTTAPRGLSLAAQEFPANLPFNQVNQVDDLNIHLQVSPGQVGRNTFIVHLYHDDNSAIGQVQLVRLFFDYQDADLGRASAELQASSQDNIFNTVGAYINQSGRWTLSVYVRRRGRDDILTDYSLDVPSPGRSATSTNPWQNPIPTLPTQVVIVGGLVALGAVPLVWGRRFKRP